MDLLFNILWNLFPFLLLIAAIVGITIFLRIFFHKKLPVYAIVSILVIGSVYLIDRSYYTTFTDVYSNHLNEETVVRSITISTTYLPDDRRFDPEADIEIEDEEMMNELIQEFSELELKKDRDHHYIENPEYRVRITTTHEMEEGLLKTGSFYFELNEAHLDGYKIVNDTDHLQMLDTLADNKKSERD
ncbi:hypothetical protein ACDX78_03755 [Virgibacillus oceani]